MRVAILSFLTLILLLDIQLQAEELTLEQIKNKAATQSKYLSKHINPPSEEAPKPDLEGFKKSIAPILNRSCLECHGPKEQNADFRVDTLNPNLAEGEDTQWWLEISAAVTNGEMPPEDGPKLSDEDRSKLISWLSKEIQVASQVRRTQQGKSSFRRMTRYEYKYALQDLLGLELDFAKDLLPDSESEDGFKNSSETLQMSASQYSTYLKLNRNALDRATIRGERPKMLFWGISAEQASANKFKNLKEDQGRDSRGAHYKNIKTGQRVPATWSFRRAVNAWTPSEKLPETPEPSDYIAVIPAGERLVIDLGNKLPDEGTLRVRFRASRLSNDPNLVPSVALEFGWQGSNNSKASVKISKNDLEIDAPSGEPRFYQWEIPLSEIYPRNPVRKTVELGTPKMTNPSEYIRLYNTSFSKSADIQFDYVEVTAPVYKQWPPASHTEIFFESEQSMNELLYAREIISRFMLRAWRRTITQSEIDSKMEYFSKIRPVCEDFQQAVLEVLATVLSSPRFLYLVESDRSQKETSHELSDFELATRLSMFLWCSVPDDELLNLAAKGQLRYNDEIVRQTKRMLADPKHKRFTKHFVRQWLDMELLDYLNIDSSAYPLYDRTLKEAMKLEPIAMFEEVLQNNHSVIDFIHADYAMVNMRLAQHYGINDVTGNQFQKVTLKPEQNRGGLLTQAGLLAMNSDGKDSNPLKRGIWMLECILNDPPPPPPPAVPEIDLADPEILKMTLKERIEDHRNKSACMSCHKKIDPWGIAFENFDAVGSWRTELKGKTIDSSSLLFNQHKLDGIDGLKRYLLANRQDQFVRALVHKITTYALGRPLTFGDHENIDRLTANLRKQGDGLATLVTLIATSDIFKSH